MLKQPRLNREATIAAILYVARRIPKPDYFRLGHLLYLADKQHLESYGRTITGQQYHALPMGPVPSVTYAALREIAGEEPNRVFKPLMDVVEQLRPVMRHVGGEDFEALDDADIEALSPSDVKCLDKVIDQFGDAGFGTIEQATQDAAWTKSFKRRPNGGIPWEDIAHTLRDSELLLEHMRDPHPS